MGVYVQSGSCGRGVLNMSWKNSFGTLEIMNDDDW